MLIVHIKDIKEMRRYTTSHIYQKSTIRCCKIYIASYIFKKYSQTSHHLQKLHKYRQQYKTGINYLLTFLSVYSFLVLICYEVFHIENFVDSYL